MKKRGVTIRAIHSWLNNLEGKALSYTSLREVILKNDLS
jgi:hypothetical protein